MFPLLRPSQPNPVELFQIWLNLPSANKMVDPHFAMLWKPRIPELTVRDQAGKGTRLTVVAGDYQQRRAAAPPPESWASESDTQVKIWSLVMEPGAQFTLSAETTGLNRTIYFYRGSGLSVSGRSIPDNHRVVLRSDAEVVLTAGPMPTEVLLLSGKPIGEPVARRGPFVMNTDQEIRRAYSDFQQTQFGGWPWPTSEYVHPRSEQRFALRPGQEIERPETG